MSTSTCDDCNSSPCICALVGDCAKCGCAALDWKMVRGQRLCGVCAMRNVPYWEDRVAELESECADQLVETLKARARVAELEARIVDVADDLLGLQDVCDATELLDRIETGANATRIQLVRQVAELEAAVVDKERLVGLSAWALRDQAERIAALEAENAVLSETRQYGCECSDDEACAFARARDEARAVVREYATCYQCGQPCATPGGCCHPHPDPTICCACGACTAVRDVLHLNGE